jgi:Tol biopolymer transport system component
MPIAALRWSPDSRRVAVLEWSRAPVAFGTVFVATLEDMTLKAIADYGGPIRSLAWSPDSSMVAYSSARIMDNGGLGPVQVWVARADGSQPPAVVMDGCAPQWTGPTLSASGLVQR